MSGEVEMMATMGGKAWSRPPITMDFQVPVALTLTLTLPSP